MLCYPSYITVRGSSMRLRLRWFMTVRRSGVLDRRCPPSGSSGSNAESQSQILDLQIPQVLQTLHDNGKLLLRSLLRGVNFHLGV